MAADFNLLGDNLVELKHVAFGIATFYDYGDGGYIYLNGLEYKFRDRYNAPEKYDIIKQLHPVDFKCLYKKDYLESEKIILLDIYGKKRLKLTERGWVRLK